MLTVKTELVSDVLANKVAYGKGSKNKKYVVVHQTGNTSKGANAKVHSLLQRNGNPRQASWHETIDDKEAIINFLPEWQCWHAGDGRGPGNLQGYALELCINSDGDYSQTIENGAQRAAQKLKDFGLNIDRLKQHNDFDGKNCPQQLRENKNGISWNDFKNKVEGYLKGKKPTQTTSTKKSNSTVAQEVIDGKWGNNPERKSKLEGAGYNYNTIQTNVNKLLNGDSKVPTKKSNSTVAQEVIDGKWGNNPARKNKLEAAGYNYKTIQTNVNKLLKTPSKASTKKSNSTVAQEVIDGKWGNNPERKSKLEAAGYNYNTIQELVNKRL